MAKKETGFRISQEQSTDVYRQLRTGSGEIAKSRERISRERLQAQLGIDKTTTFSPEDTVLGQLLIAYVNASTRLIGISEANDPMVVEEKINKQLTVPDGETPQQTFERLLNIAIENSQLINLPRHS